MDECKARMSSAAFWAGWVVIILVGLLNWHLSLVTYTYWKDFGQRTHSPQIDEPGV